MSATSPIRCSASIAPGTKVWRCIWPRKNRSSNGQTRLERDDLAGPAVGQSLGELAAVEIEMDAVLLVEPFGEMRDHVEQHFVAIGDEEGPAHRSSSRRAATSGLRLDLNRLGAWQ